MQGVWTAFGTKEASVFIDLLHRNGITPQIKEENAEWKAHLNLDTGSKIIKVCVDSFKMQGAQNIIEEYLNSEEGAVEISKNLFDIFTNDELMYAILFNSLEGTTNSFYKELNKRGWTDASIEMKKEEIIKSLYIKERGSDFALFIGFMGVLAGGVVGIVMGVILFFAGKKHPITREGFSKYDKLTDKYAKLMIACGGLVLLGFIILYAKNN